MPRKKKSEEEKFLAGSVARWKAAGYGGTVEVYIEKDTVKIRATRPRRRMPLGPNSKEQRKEAVALARDIAKRLKKKQTSAGPTAINTNGTSGIVADDVWHLYIIAKFPGFPPKLLANGASRQDIRVYFNGLSPELRKAVPGPAYLVSLLQARQRMIATSWYAADRAVAEMETGDWKAYQAAQTGRYSLNTILTDYSRFSTALSYCKKHFKKRWAGLEHPLEGADVHRPDPKSGEELGEERARILLRVLASRLPNMWRTWAACKLAYGSGRRIGAVGGGDTLGIRTASLCADDFFWEDQKLFVKWRADVAKGENYDRGDEVLPATRDVVEVYEWIAKHRPNPLGSAYPLIWSPKNPKLPVSYNALNHGFDHAWTLGLPNEARPKNLSFHAFCRTVITTIADSEGTAAAAEYTGRTEETVQRIYKRKRMATQIRTAENLDRLRSANS